MCFKTVFLYIYLLICFYHSILTHSDTITALPTCPTITTTTMHESRRPVRPPTGSQPQRWPIQPPTSLIGSLVCSFPFLTDNAHVYDHQRVSLTRWWVFSGFAKRCRPVRPPTATPAHTTTNEPYWLVGGLFSFPDRQHPCI
jgi:hypothetical protein